MSTQQHLPSSQLFEKSRMISDIRTVQLKAVSTIHQAAPVIEPGHWEKYDPFLLMMEDNFKKGAFDVHPHRGFETVTYVIDGEISHYDSATGDGGVLYPGDVQIMTAGRGVVHNETPEGEDAVHVLQLWLNLPARHKMTAPRYQTIRFADAPIHKEDGSTVRVYSGQAGNAISPALNYTPFLFAEITIEPNASFIQELPESYNGFIYILKGSGVIGAAQSAAAKGQVLDIAPSSTDIKTGGITLTAGTEGLKCIIVAGEPLCEPVVARGPFVMNSYDEIVQAYRDYSNGTFLQ